MTEPEGEHVFDLDAYLKRIGCSGRPTIAELHRAHVVALDGAVGIRDGPVYDGSGAAVGLVAPEALKHFNRPLPAKMGL